MYYNWNKTGFIE